MQLNSDFSRSVRIPNSEHRWIASPQTGVERVMLDRIGGEEARATSLVRYAKGSSFPKHTHPLGEEILVLDGTFSDDSGDYPAGWYLRNPPGSAHRPHSVEGALIFVKLRQMHPAQTDSLRIDTNSQEGWQEHDGYDVRELYRNCAEQVSMVRLKKDVPMPATMQGGAEILVVSGALREATQRHEARSWIRLPPGEPSHLYAESNGATVYLKTGHLGESPFID